MKLRIFDLENWHQAGRQLLAGGGEDAAFSFEDVVLLMISLLAIWSSGRACKIMGAPSLVGQIIIGIVVGPNLTAICPKYDAMELIGEVGLCLLVLEAGLDVDIKMIKKMGLRAAGIAVSGSLVPLAIGFGLATAVGLDWKQALVVGTSLSPTSVGIALNVLNSAKLLTTETGQLIVAAAILDDIIALILLSELEALDHPSAWAFLKPVVVAGGLLIGIGGLAVAVVPQALHKIMPKIPEKDRENFILALIFLTSIALIPGVHYAGGSHLLGAFLAGLCFCSDHHTHEAWMHQVKRIMHWLVTIFFACTIGFEIPIKQLFTGPVVANASIYFIAILGKIGAGLWSPKLDPVNFFTIGFSMSAWGEFAFVVASTARGQKIIEEDVFSAVILCVLVSVIFGPLFLRITLNYRNKRDPPKGDSAYQLDACSSQDLHPLYFILIIKCSGRPGQQSRILRTMHALDLEILDLRAYHPRGQVGSVEFGTGWGADLTSKGATTTMAVLDPTIFLPHKLEQAEHQDLYDFRTSGIKQQLLDALEDPVSSIDLNRWIPGFVDGEMIQEDPSSPSSRLTKSTSKAKLEKLGEAAVCNESNESMGPNDKTHVVAEHDGPSVRMIYAHADLELRRRYAIEFRETAGHVQFKRIASMGSTAPSKLSLEKRAKMSVSNSKFQASHHGSMIASKNRDPKVALAQLKRTGSARADFAEMGLAQRVSADIDIGRKAPDSPMIDEESNGRQASRQRHSIEMAIGVGKRYTLSGGSGGSGNGANGDASASPPVYTALSGPVINSTVDENGDGIRFSRDI